MHQRLEAFVLIVTVAALVAFGISFAVGVRRPADEVPFATDREDGARIRVEVLNGAGRAGLAEAVTDRLRERGFDVVYFGNAPSFDRERSAVYARSADTVRARAVADALDIVRLESRPRSALHLDATVLLGRDWEPPAPMPRSRVGKWLDGVRRWFAALGGSGRG